jgi:hypothetical protein
MNAYIYNVETNEIAVIVDGESNEEIESYASEFDTDLYGLSYTDFSLLETSETETVKL